MKGVSPALEIVLEESFAVFEAQSKGHLLAGAPSAIIH
jgi:hypothetical protein